MEQAQNLKIQWPTFCQTRWTSSQSSETLSTPSRISIKKPTPGKIIVKLLKNKDKKKNLKNNPQKSKRYLQMNNSKTGFLRKQWKPGQNG